MAEGPVDPKAPTLASVTHAAGVAALTLTQGPGRGELKPGPSLVGRLLAHFRVDKPIGKGGMGEVFLATDMALDRQVALKVLPRSFAGEPEYRERFLREARAQARLQHPNICHLYFIGEQDDQLFFAMEYIEGESLQERLDRLGKIPAGEAVEYCRMAALGLREAHRHGFTHRDIKPSNLILDTHGVVKLVDFGIVKAAQDAHDTGILGTPLYMAPEQARGDAVDLRADIYSLGVTLHHLVAGQPPFVGDTPLTMISKHQEDVRPRLGKQRGQASGLLDQLCDKMMAKRPADRFASYDELLAVLGRLSPKVTRIAGFWVRTFALALDLIVVLVPVVPLALLFDHFNSDATSLWLALVGAAYSIPLHARKGQTWGKRAMEIEVVRTEGSARIGWKLAVVRFVVEWGPLLLFAGIQDMIPEMGLARGLRFLLTVLSILGMLVPSLGFGVLAMLLPGQRTLWDRATTTRVVYKQVSTTSA